MDDARRIWGEKSDDDLIEAAAELDQFTEEGKAIIRAELKRRHLEDPVAQQGQDEPAGDAAPEPECLRCHVPLRFVDTNDSHVNLGWAMVPRGSRFEPSSSIYTYVCPRCGHVDQFVDTPEDDQPA